MVIIESAAAVAVHENECVPIKACVVEAPTIVALDDETQVGEPVSKSESARVRILPGKLGGDATKVMPSYPNPSD